MPPAPSNPLGFYEDMRLVGLNDVALKLSGYDVLQWQADYAGLAEDGRLAEVEDQASQLIKQRMVESGTCWGWKDPRFCLTLPMWLRALPQQAKVLVIEPIRDPVATAHSLRTRGDIVSDSRAIELTMMYRSFLHKAINSRCDGLDITHVELDYDDVLDGDGICFRHKSRVIEDWLDQRLDWSLVNRNLRHHGEIAGGRREDALHQV